MCVANGGILVQDCEAHALFETHGISNGEIEVQITSTHHQMQYPFVLNNDEYDLLYYAKPSRSYYYEGDGVGQVPAEPEIVYYHIENKPKSLAIQGHPEMMRKDAPVIEILNDLIEKCLTDAR